MVSVNLKNRPHVARLRELNLPPPRRFCATLPQRGGLDRESIAIHCTLRPRARRGRGCLGVRTGRHFAIHRSGDCGRLTGIGHGRNPRAHQGQTLLVDQAFAQLGHHDAGVSRVDSKYQDRLVGLARHDIEFPAAGAAAGRNRRLVDAVSRGVVLRRQQIQSRIPGRAVGVVAMGTVDLEPGAGPGFERAALGVVPDRQFGSLRRRRSTRQCPQSRPVLELVLHSGRVSIVAVEVPGLGTDRSHLFAGLVATLALIGVGDDIVIRTFLAVAMNPRDVLCSAGKLQGGIGLLGIPDIGQADPAVGFSFQNACLDEPSSLSRITQIAGVGKRLGDHGADGKLECLAVAVGCMRPPWQLDEAILQGVIGEERRVQIIGNDAVHRLLRGTVADEEPVSRELFRGCLFSRCNGLRTWWHSLRSLRATAAANDHEKEAAKYEGSVTQRQHSAAHHRVHSLHSFDRDRFQGWQLAGIELEVTNNLGRLADRLWPVRWL